MNREYTAVIKQDNGWWIGWIEEIPGINCQEKTHDELTKSLREALIEAIDLNREEAVNMAESGFVEELIAV